jgi:hypothetical protein
VAKKLSVQNLAFCNERKALSPTNTVRVRQQRSDVVAKISQSMLNNVLGNWHLQTLVFVHGDVAKADHFLQMLGEFGADKPRCRQIETDTA